MKSRTLVKSLKSISFLWLIDFVIAWEVIVKIDFYRICVVGMHKNFHAFAKTCVRTDACSQFEIRSLNYHNIYFHRPNLGRLEYFCMASGAIYSAVSGIRTPLFWRDKVFGVRFKVRGTFQNFNSHPQLGPRGLAVYMIKLLGCALRSHPHSSARPFGPP